jgi:hypothetical protein
MSGIKPSQVAGCMSKTIHIRFPQNDTSAFHLILMPNKKRAPEGGPNFEFNNSLLMKVSRAAGQI